MTSWVLTIDKNYPNHWDIAKRNGLWDTTKNQPILRGDHVYFWLAGTGFVGRVTVSQDSELLDGTENLPWTDGGVRTYIARFWFTDVAEPTRSVKWGEVVANTDLSKRLNPVLRTDDAASEEWLASLFTLVDEVDAAFATEEDAERAVVDTNRDTRERTLAEVAVRRGQPAFRKALLTAYDRKCAVTGSTTEQVLEAPHIFPYRGEHTNVTENGLLLRSDIHTLFDLFHVTIVFEGGKYVVRVSPEIEEEAYRSLDGNPVNVPAQHGDQPRPELLQQHNLECRWLSPGRVPTLDTGYVSRESARDERRSTTPAATAERH